MLQQTVVATVIPYFQRFRRRFPSFVELAVASEEEVMELWAGLGYYTRARNLHRAAKLVVERHGGQLPADPLALSQLPGLGPYTARAVRAITFGEAVLPVDGNIARVLCRVRAKSLSTGDPKARRSLASEGDSLVPKGRPGDFAQAMMELGARICTPRNPRCGDCPVSDHCTAFRTGRVQDFPLKVARPPKKKVVVLAVMAARGQEILWVHRPARTLLGGTWGLPFVELAPNTGAASISQANAVLEGTGLKLASPRLAPGFIRHVFTHLDVRAYLVVGRAEGSLVGAGERGDEARFAGLDDAPPLSRFCLKILELMTEAPSGDAP